MLSYDYEYQQNGGSESYLSNSERRDALHKQERAAAEREAFEILHPRFGFAEAGGPGDKNNEFPDSYVTNEVTVTAKDLSTGGDQVDTNGGDDILNSKDFSGYRYLDNEQTIKLATDFPSFTGSWVGIGIGAGDMVAATSYSGVPVVGILMTSQIVSEKTINDQTKDVVNKYVDEKRRDGVYYKFTPYPSPLYNPSATVGGSLDFYNTLGETLGSVKSWF